MNSLKITISACVLGALSAIAALPAVADSSYGGSSTGSGEWTSGANALDDAQKLIDMGSFGSAIWQLKRFLAESPNNADAHNLLAFSYRSIGKFDVAARHYDRALEINPAHAGAYAYQGVMFLETGRPEAARDNLERIREICGRGCSEYRNLRDAIQQMASLED